MNIGIVGLGVVGSACKFGFEKLGHNVTPHDLKLETKLEDLLECSVIFICVPTPSNPDGSCDISIVEGCVEQLHSLNFAGVVAIKSTLEPGTTDKFSQKYPDLELCFVPEFLRERCAISDFVENHDLLVIGSSNPRTVELVKECHGNYPHQVVSLDYTESELIKYYSNVFNALRIIFANSMYSVCEALGADYKAVKDAYILRGGIEDIYLDVNDNFRGYGGTCLPKDVKALDNLSKKLNLDLSLFETIDKENSKLETTVFKGMRL